MIPPPRTVSPVVEHDRLSRGNGLLGLRETGPSGVPSLIGNPAARRPMGVTDLGPGLLRKGIDQAVDLIRDKPLRPEVLFSAHDQTVARGVDRQHVQGRRGADPKPSPLTDGVAGDPPVPPEDAPLPIHDLAGFDPRAAAAEKRAVTLGRA